MCIRDRAIHANPYIAAFSGSLELFYVFALSSSNDRRQHHNFRAFRQGHYLIYNLVYGLLLNLLSAHRAMRDPDSGIQKPEIIIDLRYGADCGSRVFRGGFLINGNSRRQALDVYKRQPSGHPASRRWRPPSFPPDLHLLQPHQTQASTG